MPAAMIHWLAITVTAAMTATSMRITSLSFDWISATKLAAVFTGLQGLAWFYKEKRPDERLATTLSLMAKLIAFSALATLLSYAIAALDRPTWDSTLLLWDKALRFDWFAYLDFMQSHPFIEVACRTAYQSVMLQVFVAIGMLGLSGHLKRAEEFVVSYAIAGLISIAISGMMPAIGMFVHTRSDNDFIGPSDAPFVEILKALRDKSLTHISLEQMDGIITFPSFHAALGVIFIYSFWSLSKARWIGFTINALLIAGTPINGGHYFVDILAGVAVAAAAIWAARRVPATRFFSQQSAKISTSIGLCPQPATSA